MCLVFIIFVDVIVYNVYKAGFNVNGDTVSVRLPKRLSEELNKFIGEEKLDRSAALRKLIAESIESWKRNKALEKLEKGKVSFNRAAQIAGMDVWSFAALVKERGITWVRDKRALRDLEAA